MLYQVVFSNLRHGNVYEEYEVHANSGVGIFGNTGFWEDVKKIARRSREDSVKSWATRSPCVKLPLCLKIGVYQMAVDRLTAEKERCRWVGSVKF